MIYCRFEFFGAKSIRTVFARIGDAVVRAYKVEAFGPGDIVVHDGVVYVVNIGAYAVLHGIFARFCNFSAFRKGFWVVDARVFEFPAVFWMGFADVDYEKVYPFVICCIEIAEANCLADKGRSREAAEDECDGFVFAKMREARGVFAVDVR